MGTETVRRAQQGVVSTQSVVMPHHISDRPPTDTTSKLQLQLHPQHTIKPLLSVGSKHTAAKPIHSTMHPPHSPHTKTDTHLRPSAHANRNIMDANRALGGAKYSYVPASYQGTAAAGPPRPALCSRSGTRMPAAPSMAKRQ